MIHNSEIHFVSYTFKDLRVDVVGCDRYIARRVLALRGLVRDKAEWYHEVKFVPVSKDTGIFVLYISRKACINIYYIRGKIS